MRILANSSTLVLPTRRSALTAPLRLFLTFHKDNVYLNMLQLTSSMILRLIDHLNHVAFVCNRGHCANSSSRREGVYVVRSRSIGWLDVHVMWIFRIVLLLSHLHHRHAPTFLLSAHSVVIKRLRSGDIILNTTYGGHTQLSTLLATWKLTISLHPKSMRLRRFGTNAIKSRLSARKSQPYHPLLFQMPIVLVFCRCELSVSSFASWGFDFMTLSNTQTASNDGDEGPYNTTDDSNRQESRARWSRAAWCVISIILKVKF